MSTSADGDAAQWTLVDEGWGRRAVEFATLSEPANCREYVVLHHRLAVDHGDELLDLACGAGLAVELAALRGARCAGIDASPRLLEVARDRVPVADLRVGDMNQLPWTDDSFDVVTSFRGIWGTTPTALAEAHRVLRPGGRIGFTVWGHLKASPGAWALAPFRLAEEPKVANQAAMVSLGRPGAGEDLLERYGFVDIERLVVPFVWEFADPETYARTLASTGPAYEAILAVGEEKFHRHAVALAAERVREGRPLRAEIDVVGYVARTPERAGAHSPAGTSAPAAFLAPAPASPEAEALFDQDRDEMGFVMNVSRYWAHLPAHHEALFALMGQAARAAGLSVRDRGILVTSMAATLGDSYCALAWGLKLAGFADMDTAAAVLAGLDDGLDERERALASWSRKVVADPNATTGADVAPLRAAGYDDAQILAITLFVSLRLAFSTVNGALGIRPDRELGRTVPAPVREAVTWGRPIADDVPSAPEGSSG